MPHGGYHGNIVGLGSKPTTGTTDGPVGMGSPPPKQKPKLKPSNTNQDGIMSSEKKAALERKKAAQSMASQGILNLAGDVTSNQAGNQALIKQYQSGSKFNVDRFAPVKDNDSVINEDVQITETKPKEKVTETTNYKPTYKSKLRDFATKFMPVVFPQYAYGIMAGQKENVPLTIDNFSDKELSFIKNRALFEMVDSFGSLPIDQFGKLKPTSPVVVEYYSGNPLGLILRPGERTEQKSVGGTLGSATAYINNEGELIVTDYYDWKTGVDLTNPDTGQAPTTVDEWKYTVTKNVQLYFDGELQYSGVDYDRPQGLVAYPNTQDEKKLRKRDANFLSSMFMDAAESLANITGPQPYEQSSIFEVPKEKRMFLNLGKIETNASGVPDNIDEILQEDIVRTGE